MCFKICWRYNLYWSDFSSKILSLLLFKWLWTCCFVLFSIRYLSNIEHDIFTKIVDKLIFEEWSLNTWGNICREVCFSTRLYFQEKINQCVCVKRVAVVWECYKAHEQFLISCCHLGFHTFYNNFINAPWAP